MFLGLESGFGRSLATASTLSASMVQGTLADCGSNTRALVDELTGRHVWELAARLIRIVGARVNVFAEEILASALLEPVGELG